MVVLDTERPVWCEAAFKSNADGATPSGSLADANSAPVIVLRMLKRLLVTAAPPFTYSRVAFRA